MRKKEGEGGSWGEFGGRGLAGVLRSLVGTRFPVIGAHHGYRWWPIDVDWVCTSVSSPSLSSPLFSSPVSSLSSPPALFRAVQVCLQGCPGAFSGTCSPGRQHLTALACGRASGHVRGRCERTCRWLGYGVA